VSDHLSVGYREVDSGAILVDYSATRLITFASWSSSVAPALIGFALCLGSYPIAKGILLNSQKQNTSELPTPYQPGLLLRMLAKGMPPMLWYWIDYARKKPRQRQSYPLKAMTAMLALGTLLRYL